MEFTTYFSLRFQANLLLREVLSAVPNLHAFALLKDRHTGLTPSMGIGVIHVQLRRRGTACKTSPERSTPRTRKGHGALRWADPVSLAVTKGIPVGFFSSAY